MVIKKSRLFVGDWELNSMGVATILYLGMEISSVQNIFTFSPFSFWCFCKTGGRAKSISYAVLNLRCCLCFCHPALCLDLTIWSVAQHCGDHVLAIPALVMLVNSVFSLMVLQWLYLDLSRGVCDYWSARGYTARVILCWPLLPEHSLLWE